MKLPACYFPTTIYLIDDDKAFITGLLFKLNNNQLFRYTTNPLNALKLLQTKAQAMLLPSLHSFLKEDLEDDQLEFFDFDLTQYVHLSYQPKRFEHISVLIIDYKMPEMNGIEFIKQLGNNSSVKKILLTGEADSSIAINAFNEGLIDRYITKDFNMYANLNKYISDLQQEYFLDVTSDIMKFFSRQATFLKQQKFLDFFTKFLHQYGIIEYYLLDRSGSFLLLDKFANYYALIIRSAQELQNYAEIAQGNDAPLNIVKSLKNCQQLPVFLSEEDYSCPVSMWEDYLYPTKKLAIDEGDFYYVTVENFSTEMIDKNRLVSLKKYKKNRLAESRVFT